MSKSFLHEYKHQQYTMIIDAYDVFLPFDKRKRPWYWVRKHDMGVTTWAGYYMWHHHATIRHIDRHAAAVFNNGFGGDNE